MSLTHLDLFSGIGGFALAAKWAGFETVQFVEWEPFPQRVLTKNFPGVPIHGDIRTYDATHIQRPALVTGGFPCQDISGAGRGAGIEGSRSGLWFEMLRIVRECRPLWVVAENSPFLRVRGADRVLGDLEGSGYAARAVVVGAGSAGAPHRRKRVFVVAADAESVPRHDEAPAGVSLGSGREAGAVLRPALPWAGAGPRVSRMDDGLPDRLDRSKALGNAIVPQVAYPILAAIARECQSA